LTIDQCYKFSKRCHHLCFLFFSLPLSLSVSPSLFSFSSPFCVSLSCSLFYFPSFSLLTVSLRLTPYLCVFSFLPPLCFSFFFYRAPSLVYLSASQQQTNFEFPSKMLSILQNRLLKIGMNLGLKLGKVLATNIFLLDLWEKIKA